MINQNSLLKFGLIFLKILAILVSVLLFVSVLLLITGRIGAILLPGPGLVIEFAAVVVLLAIITVVLWALIFLLSKFIKPLR